MIREFKTQVGPYPVLQNRLQVEDDLRPQLSFSDRRIWEKETRAGHEEDIDQKID